MPIEPANVPNDDLHMTNEETETALRRFLLSRGFHLNEQSRANGTTGPDIVATRARELPYYIEVIGYKRSGPARSKDFYEGVFRALARLAMGAQRIVLACPYTFQDGLPQRVRYLGRAWLRFGSAFPELEIWFVYPKGTRLSYASWGYWGRKVLDPPEVIDGCSRRSCRFGPPVMEAASEFHEQHERFNSTPRSNQ